MAYTKNQINRIVKDYIYVVKKVFHVDKAYLFGSALTGKMKKWSDIDIAVVSKDFNNMDYHLACVILSKLKREIDYAIAPIPMTPEDLIEPPVGSIHRTVKKLGKVVYP